jgi:hypothetical protein
MKRDIKSILLPKPERGRYETNVMRDQYHAIPRLNPSSLASGLMGWRECNPAAIRMAWEKPDSEPRAASSQDRLDRGTLAHLLVLQPELLMERVAIWTGGRRASAEWDQFESENDGKLIIKSTDYADVSTAVNEMRSEPMVANIIRGIEAEVALYGVESCGGVHIATKGQVDGVHLNRRVIVDLKTTEAGIDQHSVERTIRTFHYREKMASYRRLIANATGTQTDDWRCYNLFMSLTPPYGVRLIKFTTWALDWGQERMLDATQAVAKCLAADEWPMYCVEGVMDVAEFETEDEDREEIDYASGSR